MRKRVILLDFDGVIADSFEVYYQVMVRTLREFGYSCVRNPEDFRSVLDGNLFASLAALEVRPEDMGEILSEASRKVLGRLGEIELFPGIPEALHGLCERCPVYLVTSNHGTVAEAVLGRAGLLGCFQDVLGAEVDPSKTRKIRTVRGRHPGRGLVYVGDTVGDLREARAARASRAAALWGWHDAERLRREDPEYLLASPGDLPALASAPARRPGGPRPR